MDPVVKQPILSVLMPVFNAELYLRETIDSILSQTFSDFEFICIDDASTDSSLEILKSYTDPRIIIVANKHNKGQIVLMNEAVALAKGKYLARMDADDVSSPERFQKQIDFLDKHPEVGVVVSRIRLIDKYGNPAGFWPEDKEAITNERIKSLMPFSNCIAQPSMMMRSEVLANKKYQTSFKACEDWGMWLELLSEGVIISKVDEELLSYRIHPSSVTSQSNQDGGSLKKEVRFKWNYILYKLSGNSFKSYDLLVLFSLLKGLVSYPWVVLIKPTLKSIRKILNARPWDLAIDYLKLTKELSRTKSTENYFFFPFYHTGGAEIVHAEIVETVKEKQPVIFFTGVSADDSLLSHFQDLARCIVIGRLCSFPFFREITIRLVSGYLNKLDSATLFGCNSAFYYKLLPKLEGKFFCCDLIHAFVHPEEIGAEHWSLNVADKLDKRVFVSRLAMEQMEGLYQKNSYSPELCERFVFISNFTKLSEQKRNAEDFKGPLQVYYIGRGTAEKRVSLVGQIASLVKREDSQIQFNLIGNVETSVTSVNKKDCNFLGEVNERRSLEQHLSKAHILLLTSSREGMPLVIMEAMAHGVVPISTSVGDVPAYVKEDVSGFLLEVKDTKKMVEKAVAKILELDKDRDHLKKISDHALETARISFSRDNFYSQYRLLFSEAKKKR